MADDLLELHNLASTLLETLEPRQRRTLLRRLAGDMRRANQRRMARQKAPDGTAWEKRKPRTAAAAATRPTRFLYPSGGGGEPRLVDMRSWIGRGDMIVGFDREADGLRTFRKDRVIRWLPAEGAAEPDGLPAACAPADSCAPVPVQTRPGSSSQIARPGSREFTTTAFAIAWPSTGPWWTIPSGSCWASRLQMSAGS